jgi:macrolide transport system ATP-binding/permease protein
MSASERRKAEDLNRELQSHLEIEAEEQREAGLPEEEARYAARRTFGNTTLVAEDVRAAWGHRWSSDLRQDLRIGARMLWRSPGFTILAVLCLTVAIGANAAVFGWIEGTLLRPYPLVQHEDRMFAMTGTNRSGRPRDDMSWPDLQDLEKSSQLAEAFIVDKITGATLNLGDRAETLTGSVVSANYFDALGVRPILGRGFRPEENAGRNSHPVVVISYQNWQNRFHGDPSIIGQTIRLNDNQFTIVGVAPQGFYGTFVGYSFQFWVPASMQQLFDYTGTYKLEDRGARWIEGYVFLKPGVTMGQAQQELATIGSRLETTYPETDRGRSFQLYPLWKTPFNVAGDLGPTLGIALFVVVFVLIIACANVGNLMLVRAFARRREMTVRLAMGAGRWRLIRQLLTEGIMLCSMAAACGLCAAIWCQGLLTQIVGTRSATVYLHGALDWRVCVAVAGLCVFAALVFSLLPALQGSKIELATALRLEASGVVGGGRKAWLRSALVGVQVALSFLLLVGASLILLSLQRMNGSSPGFRTDVQTTYVRLPAKSYDLQRAKTFQDELLDRVRTIPSVQSAALTRLVPFTYAPFSTAPIAIDGYVPPSDQQLTGDYSEVSPGYFATMGIPLVSGRDFTRADNESGAPVAIVNTRMVELYWHGQDAVGQRLQVAGQWMRIVGVVAVSKYRNFMETPQPFFYVPLRQNPARSADLVVRTALPLKTASTEVFSKIREMDAGLTLFEMITMREQINRTNSSQHVAVTMLSAFGGAALLLAAIGLYGVMSYAVSQSARELGLRMALGAHPQNLMRLVLKRGLVLTALGIVGGAATALGTTRLLGYLLYKVSPYDALSFSLAFAVMTAVAVAACLGPAWRAARTDPIRALQAS